MGAGDAGDAGHSWAMKFPERVWGGRLYCCRGRDATSNAVYLPQKRHAPLLRNRPRALIRTVFRGEHLNPKKDVVLSVTFGPTVWVFPLPAGAVGGCEYCRAASLKSIITIWLVYTVQMVGAKFSDIGFLTQYGRSKKRHAQAEEEAKKKTKIIITQSRKAHEAPRAWSPRLQSLLAV